MQGKFVSIPKRVSEFLKPLKLSLHRSNLIVSIPKRVSEFLKHWVNSVAFSPDGFQSLKGFQSF